MATTRAKRGKTHSRKKTTTRKRVKKTSIGNRFLAVLPFTDDQLRKGFTFFFLLLFLVLAVVIARMTGLTDVAQKQVTKWTADAGFEVRKIEIRNVKQMNELAIYEVVLAEQNRAMTKVDLEDIRAKLMTFGWVADARVSRQLPDTLIVDIVERVPKAVWKNGDDRALVDSNGVVLEELKTGDHNDMLEISGENSQNKIDDLFVLLDNAPALMSGVAAAKWVGKRRWDLRFKTGEILALPEGDTASAAALIDFARMDGISRILGQGVSYFDMRDPERAYFRKNDKTSLIGQSGENISKATDAKSE